MDNPKIEEVKTKVFSIAGVGADTSESDKLAFDTFFEFFIDLISQKVQKQGDAIFEKVSQAKVTILLSKKLASLKIGRAIESREAGVKSVSKSEGDISISYAYDTTSIQTSDILRLTRQDWSFLGLEEESTNLEAGKVKFY